MAFPILGANSATGGYEVENSLRFNQGDTAHLDKTFGSAGTSNKTGTLSFWYKRTTVDNVDFLFHVYPNRGGHSNDRTFIAIGSDNKLAYERIFEGSTQSQLKTTQLFRDVSAWYHIVVVFDTTQATDTNRFKLYVNGNQVTSFSTTNYPGQNVDIDLADAHLHTVGAGYSEGSYVHPLDGYLTEYHYIDGTAKAQTDFGEFDDNGVWIPIKYTGSYGTNGFYLEFQQTGTSQNSSGIGADTSGNDNHFAVTNLAATDVTEDTCTNNFVTLNPITPVVTHTLSEGNCKSTNSSGTHGGTTATINLPTSGKWYWEVKIEAESSDKGQGVGIGNQIYRSATDWGNYANMVIYLSDGTKQNESGYASYGNAHNANDIIGVAYNADDQELTFYHNNSSQGTIPTSEMDGIIDFDNISPIVFGRNVTQSFNFGNPPYSISSGNTDGKYGNFEYAPPSGYYALCTKRLAEFG